jgi:hypothetical protein
VETVGISSGSNSLDPVSVAEASATIRAKETEGSVDSDVTPGKTPWRAGEDIAVPTGAPGTDALAKLAATSACAFLASSAATNGGT